MRRLLHLIYCLSFISSVFAYNYTHMDNVTNNSNLDGFSNQIFDFNYTGDIFDLLDKLKNYDPKLKILHYWGKRTSVTINIDLQMVNIYDVIDAINIQTNGSVAIIYDSKLDTIRLNYLHKLDVAKDALDESLKWQNGHSPKPILKADGVVRFPFGEYEPIITCEPMNLCDLELQSGEKILGIAIGDSLRWNQGDQGIPIVYSGSSDKLTPHLILKPSEGGLNTSLIITTSKRTYMLKLKSASNGYIARAGFYYPEELVQKYEDDKESLIKTINQGNTLTTNQEYLEPQINISKIKYNYTVNGDDYQWKPTQVFDDGISVYIQMPESIDAKNLPGLCILVDGDDSETKCEMVNFRYNDHYYIVDKLFDEAKLVNGYDDTAQIITIKHKNNRSFWSRLFG